MSKIGKNIQAARLRAGLTQEELALRMGYKSKSTINKIEQGVNDIPQSKIVKFAEVLRTTPGELMGWVSEDTAKKNDQLAQLIVKMRSDADLLQLVKELADLTPEQRASVRGLLAAFGGSKGTISITDPRHDKLVRKARLVRKRSFQVSRDDALRALEMMGVKKSKD